jgi:prepilin-type N-terminal cleavage/methylation domain-containing protein
MKSGLLKRAFTLIEMILVVAIIVILVSMVVGVAKRIDDQGKERLCRNTLALIDNALEQFRDFGYEYKDPYFAGLVFPLDCNSFPVTSGFPYLNLQDTLYRNIYPTAALPFPVVIGGAYDPNFSGSAAMYFILSQVPECRITLDKIDKSLLTNTGSDGSAINISINIGGVVTTLPFLRINDPWKMPLNYDYYPDLEDYQAEYPSATWEQYVEYRNRAKLTFPVITSAGADKRFGTNDDIINGQGR